MKTRTTLALLALTLGTLPAMAQQLDANGIGRTELVRHDFDTTREAIQVRVDFGPGVAFPRHSHPGVEIAHVEQGTIEYDLDGKRVLLRTGETVYIPAGVVHSARNVGSGNAAELATYTGPGAAGRPLHIKVTLDGQPPGADHGTDIDADGNGVVTATRLYQLVRQSGKVRARRFEVRFLDRGAEAYAFTFG